MNKISTWLKRIVNSNSYSILAIVSSIVAILAVYYSLSASMWFFHQPKVPKSLRK